MTGKIFALDLTGHRQKEVPLTGSGFRLQPELNAAWYEIIAEAALPKLAAPPSQPPPGAEGAKKKPE